MARAHRSRSNIHVMRGKFRLLFGHLHAGVAVFFAILNSDLLIDTAVSSRRGRQ